MAFVTIYARPLGWTVVGDALFCAHEIGWRLRAVTIKEIAAIGVTLAALVPAAPALAQPWPTPLPDGHIIPLCSQLSPLPYAALSAPLCIRNESEFFWSGQLHYIDEVADADDSDRCLGRGDEALALVRDAFDRGVDIAYGAAPDPRGIPRSIVTLRDTKESVGQLLIDKGLAVPAGTTDC